MGLKSWLREVRGKTLYFPGCLTTALMREEFERYKEIFSLLDLDFVLMPEVVCCGLVAYDAGYRKDARQMAARNFEQFTAANVRKIITSCSTCYYYFKEVYPTLVRGWDIAVEHSTVAICRALRVRGIRAKPSGDSADKVIYHDACFLGKQSGIYDEPREIIARLGGTVLEFEDHRKEALCCGAAGGYMTNYSQQALTIAERKVSLAPDSSSTILSPCVLCHFHMSKVTPRSKEFSEFILRKLRGLNV